MKAHLWPLAGNPIEDHCIFQLPLVAAASASEGAHLPLVHLALTSSPLSCLAVCKLMCPQILYLCISLSWFLVSFISSKLLLRFVLNSADEIGIFIGSYCITCEH